MSDPFPDDTSGGDETLKLRQLRRRLRTAVIITVISTVLFGLGPIWVWGLGWGTDRMFWVGFFSGAVSLVFGGGTVFLTADDISVEERR